MGHHLWDWLRGIRDLNELLVDGQTPEDIIENVVHRGSSRRRAGQILAGNSNQSAPSFLEDSGNPGTPNHNSTPNPRKSGTNHSFASSAGGSSSFDVWDHVGGTPLQQENEIVSKGESHVWETRTLKTMHKLYLKPLPTSEENFYYIPWEIMTICHNYKELQIAFEGALLRKPVSAPESSVQKGNCLFNSSIWKCFCSTRVKS